MLENKNYDDVFLRSIIVGLVSFLYDVISIKQTVNNVEGSKKVPFFYSEGGDIQFMTDYFLNTDKYCNILSPKIEGNMNKIPSGRLTLTTSTVADQELTSGYIRIKHKKKVETEFTTEERDFASRGEFIPIQMIFEAKVQCGSSIERMKIWQQINIILYRVRKFWIRFGGVEKIPVMISFPSDYTIPKEVKYKYPDNEKLGLDFNIEVMSYLPALQVQTERQAAEHIDHIAKSTVISDETVSTDDTTDTIPSDNSEYIVEENKE